ALNANDYFNNLLGVEKPDFKVHQFGADGGGPVIKDRTHWFASWQTTRLNFTQPIAEVFGTPIVYTDLARQGIYRHELGMVTLPEGPLTVEALRDAGVDAGMVEAFDAPTAQARARIMVPRRQAAAAADILAQRAD
ncbi:MAG: hypothetical protein ACRD08_16000, partial [Acidimicrobiales bacterium]